MNETRDTKTKAPYTRRVVSVSNFFHGLRACLILQGFDNFWQWNYDTNRLDHYVFNHVANEYEIY